MSSRFNCANPPKPPAGDFSSGSALRRGIEDFRGRMAGVLRVEAVQIEGGDFQSRSEFVRARGASLHLERFSRRVHFSCGVRDGWMVVGIPVEPAGSRWNGLEIRDSGVPLIVAGGNVEWSVGAGASMLLVAVERRRIVSLAGKVFMATENPGAIGLAARCAILRADPAVTCALRRDLLALLESGLQDRLIDQVHFQNRILAGVVRLIDSSSWKLVAHAAKATLVRRARALLAVENPSQRVHNLREGLRVGDNTLHHAFKSLTGVTTKSFILSQQYSAARLALLKANPENSRVTDVALGLGFTELGRFSVMYRNFFGESPSVTLARRWDASHGGEDGAGV